MAFTSKTPWSMIASHEKAIKFLLSKSEKHTWNLYLKSQYITSKKTLPDSASFNKQVMMEWRKATMIAIGKRMHILIDSIRLRRYLRTEDTKLFRLTLIELDDDFQKAISLYFGSLHKPLGLHYLNDIKEKILNYELFIFGQPIHLYPEIVGTVRRIIMNGECFFYHFDAMESENNNSTKHANDNHPTASEKIIINKHSI